MGLITVIRWLGTGTRDVPACGLGMVLTAFEILIYYCDEKPCIMIYAQAVDCCILPDISCGY